MFKLTDEEEFPLFEFAFPPVLPEVSFPPAEELESILKLMLELLFWFDVQLVVLFTLTCVFELLPLPEITILVPLTWPEGLGDGSSEGDAVGVGEEVSAGVGDIEGLAAGEVEGLGKLAAAENELFKAEALLENNPKTDWLSPKSTKQIKNELKK